MWAYDARMVTSSKRLNELKYAAKGQYKTPKE